MSPVDSDCGENVVLRATGGEEPVYELFIVYAAASLLVVIILIVFAWFMAYEEDVPYVFEEEPVLDDYDDLSLYYNLLGTSETSNEIEDPVVLAKEKPDPLSLRKDSANLLEDHNLVHENNSKAEEPDIVDIMESEGNKISKWHLKMLAEQFLCFLNYVKQCPLFAIVAFTFFVRLGIIRFLRQMVWLSWNAVFQLVSYLHVNCIRITFKKWNCSWGFIKSYLSSSGRMAGVYAMTALSFNMTYTDKFFDARWVYSKVLGITKNLGHISNCQMILIMIGYVCVVSGNRAPSIYPNDNSSHYYVGDLVTVSCTASQEYFEVHWVLNNSRYNYSHTDDIEIDSRRTIAYIFISNITQEYNNTAIRCEGSYRNGQSFSSDEVIILLQGILRSVTNLSSVNLKIVNISWIAPYSIDVPSTDPDITYCVDIYNSSAAEPTRISSKCHINQTSHQGAYYPMLIACAEYQVKVIAVNKVGNSTAATLPVGIKDISVSEVIVSNLERENTSVKIIMDQTLCPDRIEVKVNEMEITDKKEDVKNNLTAIVFNLPNNKIYIATIINQIPMNEQTVTFTIRTYDINTTNAEMVSSYLLLKTSFVNNSSAQGVLYAFMYLNDGIIDFSKSRYLPVKRFEAELGINVTDVEIFKGLYRILSFEIEKNFEIQGDGSPADVTYINSTSNLPNADSNVMGHSKDIENFNVVVYANCSQDGFFQAIFQTYNGTIESADYIETKRARCSEKVTFTRKGNVSYNVAVFPEMQYPGILTSNKTITEPLSATTVTQTIPKESLIGLIIPIMICIILIFILVIIFLVSRKFIPSANRQSASVLLERKPDQSCHAPVCISMCDRIKAKQNETKNKPETIPTARIDELSDAERADQNKTMNNPVMQTACSDKLSDAIKDKENATNCFQNEAIFHHANRSVISGWRAEVITEAGIEKGATLSVQTF